MAAAMTLGRIAQQLRVHVQKKRPCSLAFWLCQRDQKMLISCSSCSFNYDVFFLFTCLFFVSLLGYVQRLQKAEVRGRECFVLLSGPQPMHLEQNLDVEVEICDVLPDWLVMGPSKQVRISQ